MKKSIIVICFSVFCALNHFEKVTGQNNSNKHFTNKQSFSHIIFQQKGEFRRTIFDSSTNFEFSKFKKGAYFYYAIFNSEANFFGVEFDSVAHFIYAKFGSFADFSNSRFPEETDFSEAVLPDSMGFRLITNINKEIDLTVAKLDTAKKAKDKNYKCKICLTGSDISKIKINYELFQLWFPESEKLSYEAKISTYEKLLKKFKDDGFLESYKVLDVEYQNFRNIQKGDIALNWFLKNWWNYGYNKEWVIYWSLVLVGIFSFINILLFKRLQSKVYEMTFAFYDNPSLQKIDPDIDANPLPESKKSTSSLSRALLKPWHYFAVYIVNPIIYTTILFFGFRVSLEKFKKFSILTLYVWLIYLVGIFCLAYIFNIIIVK